MIKEIKHLIHFFFKTSRLMKGFKMHRQNPLFRGLSDDIRTHFFEVAVTGYFLAEESGANSDKVLKMSLLYALRKTKSENQEFKNENWVHKRYLKLFEEEIKKGKLEESDVIKELSAFQKEYNEGETLEVKIVKDANLLNECSVLEEYEWQEDEEAKKRIDEIIKQLSTEAAKELVSKTLDLKRK